MYLMTKNTQQGFTIVELMIALILGVIIMIAVGQVYVMSVRTSSMQQAGSSILDANVFGLQQVERNLRLAGLDLADRSNLTQRGSGIVTSVENLQGISGFEARFVTSSASGPSATSQRSDQLTIQYRAPTDMRDCEGRIVLGPRKASIAGGGDTPVSVYGQTVVERYFLRDNNGSLELRCDSGRYITDDIVAYNDPINPVPAEHQSAILLGAQRNQLRDFGDEGALVAAGIDHFKVKLAVVQAGTNIRYVSPNQYVASMGTNAIIAVKTAILARGTVPVVGSEIPDGTYRMLGEDIALSATTADKRYVRRVYESNSMLRNSRGR